MQKKPLNHEVSVGRPKNEVSLPFLFIFIYLFIFFFLAPMTSTVTCLYRL